MEELYEYSVARIDSEKRQLNYEEYYGKIADMICLREICMDSSWTLLVPHRTSWELKNFARNIHLTYPRSEVASDSLVCGFYTHDHRTDLSRPNPSPLVINSSC
jgi:hypothetical protein